MKDSKVVQSSTWALILLTGVNYLNYIDRYILASLLPYIQADMNLNDVQLGLLTSAFMYPYLFIAPLFGVWGDRIKRNFLAAGGVFVWSVATVFTGLSNTYTSLVASRMFLGVGEASFSVIAPAWLADFFTPEKRGRVMAIFSAALPVGAAIGYILGGALGDSIGWRLAFMIVGGPGIVLAVLLWLLGDKQPKKADSSEAPKFSIKLFSNLFYFNGAYRHIVLGYCAYTFVVGGLANWMPIFLVRYYKVEMGDLPAGVIFGGIAAASGFLGTMIGGYLADRWDLKSGNGYAKLSAISMWLSLPSFVVLSVTTSYTVFLSSLFVTMTMLFISTSPINVMILNSVANHWRSTAMAMSIFASHFLGDAISTPIIGFISENYGGLRVALVCMTPVSVLSAIFWTWVIFRHFRTVPTAGSEPPRGLQAHRGYVVDGVPENSPESIENAKKQGFGVVEIDVRLSKDGVPVVFHDETFDRTFDSKERVDQLDYAELHRRFQIERLGDILKVDGPEWFNLDLKANLGQERAIVESLKTEIQGSSRRLVLSSFNPKVLRWASKLVPEILRAAIVGRRSSYVGNLLFYARPHFIHAEDGLYSDTELEQFVSRNVKVVIWTVNDKKRAEELIELGVHGVITDTVLPVLV